jgi:glucose-6-phosphate isomerase
MSTSKLKLNLNHSTTDLSSPEFKEKIEKVKSTPVPNFAKYSPDLEEIKKLKEKYKDKKNIIVEGNGGSISNFRGIYSALGNKENKNVFILDTEDPDYIYELKNKCSPKDTLVILTSKSGTRIQVLANYFAFQDYPILIITEDNNGALNQIRKIKNLDISFYPKTEITDRYTGLTESALTTAEIVEINTEKIIKGGKEMYSICDPQSDLKNNPALQFALTLDKLEKVGYIEMFLSIYSKKLSGFFELIKQLFHESVCKNELGQTIYGGNAPENQHHTLQRLISGRKNSLGFFITVKNPAYEEGLKIEDDLKNIKCRNIILGDLNNISLNQIIKAEFQGTWQDVIDNNIPAIHLELEEISPYTIGQFMAFFQYTAFYSASLRGVNPCDQPGVEKSKENIFGIVEKIKG